ncbi:UDP-glycosyltransferase 79B6-like [Mercurialis annua]|uniref:UDP-glycosyltransferase 79B6-like n=1 Tax=Mercurialis annua TaxID=3986 RepID=UPI00215FEF3F|nr:UDP-glycosyltransferase 79B6-like [Mercurialis annua]
MAPLKSSNFHIVMFPWFAVGHMTPFLHLANRLAQRGCSISFLLPKKAKQQLQHFNLHPHLISFHSITVPPVDGLPVGTETASDIPIHMTHFLSIALDRTRDQVEKVILETKPKLVLFDVAHWIPEITRPLGIKTINYNVVSAASVAIALVPARNVTKDRPITEAELLEPPVGYPSENVVLRGHEARSLLFVSFPFGEGISFYERIYTAMKGSDSIAIRTCQELEGKFCDYISTQYDKPVFLTGPILPDPSTTPLEERWANWLSGFEKGSVIFCAFGSQIRLDKNQFQGLVLGLESTGLPFLAALKAPNGAKTIEEALPEGFEERVKGRGVVSSGWVQQLMILDHPSVGCFLNHCGFGSMWESLMSDCQIVLVPHLGDQILNTRFMASELKVAVEVARDENGWFAKETLTKAIKSVMDKDSELGSVVKENHKKWKEILGCKDYMSGYIDKFVKNMHDLVNK